MEVNMKVKEYQMNELAEARKVQEDCLRLHMLPSPVMHWGYEIKDADGLVTESGKGKANSYTRNALNMLSWNLGLAPATIFSNAVHGDGNLSIKQLTGTICSVDVTYFHRSTAGLEGYLGTGGETESLDSYELGAVLYTGPATINTTFDSDLRKRITTLTYTYVNSSGSSKAINESGIGLYSIKSLATPSLFIYDVFTAITVANGQSITWVYAIEVAYPNP